MCGSLKSQICSFSFQITQSADLNISIGITDREDKDLNGRGAIYYTGRTGSVYENGKEVNFHIVKNLNEHREKQTSDHK